jgi:hypothetical protein
MKKKSHVAERTIEGSTLQAAHVNPAVIAWLIQRKAVRLRPAGQWKPRVKGLGWTYAPPVNRDPDDPVERALVAQAVLQAKSRQAKEEFRTALRHIFAEHDILTRLSRCVEPEAEDVSQFVPTTSRPRTRDDFVEQHRRATSRKETHA